MTGLFGSIYTGWIYPRIGGSAQAMSPAEISAWEAKLQNDLQNIAHTPEYAALMANALQNYREPEPSVPHAERLAAMGVYEITEA